MYFNRDLKFLNMELNQKYQVYNSLNNYFSNLFILYSCHYRTLYLTNYSNLYLDLTKIFYFSIFNGHK